MKLLIPILVLLFNCSTIPDTSCPVNRDHPSFVQTAQRNFCKIVQPKLISCVNKDTAVTKKAGTVNMIVSYKVEGSGTLKSVHISDNDKIGTQLKACIKKQAAKQKFEANPDGAEFHLDFLFNFAIEGR